MRKKGTINAYTFPQAGNYNATQPKPKTSVRKSLGPIDRENANVEAEKNETVAMPGKGGMLNFYGIGGKRHAQGGTPLNLPDDSFIFSDFKTKLKIKDPEILKLFGKGGDSSKKGYTPAELSKQYNINEYVKVLASPDSTKLEKDTAELMIKNYTSKLGQLALVQESMKGFPDGIPSLAYPYLYSVGIDPSTILPVDQNELSNIQQSNEEYDMENTEMPTAQNGLNYTNSYQKPIVHKGTAPQQGLTEQFLDYVGRVTGLDKLNKQIYTPDFSKSLQTPNSAQSQLRDLAYRNMMTRMGSYKNGGSVRMSLPKKQGGGPIKGDIIVDFIDDPYQLELIISNAQKDNPGKSVFVNYSDGSYKKIKGNVIPRTQYKGKQDLGKLTQSYEKLNYIFNNDEKLRDEVYNNYKSEIEKSNLDSGTKKKLLAKDADDVINNLLEHQKQVYMLAGSDIDLNSEDWDKSKNKTYYKAADKLEFDPLTNDQIAMAQAAYWGTYGAAGKPEFKYLADNFQLGFDYAKGDEPDKRTNKISPVDTIFGNTTNRQGIFAKSDYEEEPAVDEKNEDAIEPVDYQSPEYVSGVSRPEWWTQNVVDLQGAVEEWAGINKYYPNLYTVNLPELSPTYVSPERGLAAIAEQSAITNQGLGTFAGPQAYSSRASQLAGAGMKSAVDYLSGVHNQNVGIANQFEMAQKQMNSQEQMANLQSRQRFDDQMTVLNQQYDNAKRMTKRNIRKAFNQGLTGAQETATMNALYPNYQVDPVTGQVYFSRGEKVTPSSYDQEDSLRELNRLKGIYPEIDDNILWKYVSGQNVPDTYANPMDAYQQMMGYYNG